MLLRIQFIADHFVKTIKAIICYLAGALIPFPRRAFGIQTRWQRASPPGCSARELARPGGRTAPEMVPGISRRSNQPIDPDLEPLTESNRWPSPYHGASHYVLDQAFRQTISHSGRVSGVRGPHVARPDSPAIALRRGRGVK